MATQACELSLLQHAQQLALQVHGHLANFVQKQGAALGLLEQAFLFAVSPGEGPFFVTKQHVFDQVFRHGCAIERHKRALCAAGSFVQHAGQNLFARACGAHQQSGHIGVGDFFGQGQQVLAGGVDKHHIAHGLRRLAGCGRDELVVQSLPRGGANILCGQHGQRACLGGFNSQVQGLAVDAADHGQVEAGVLQELLHGFEPRHLQIQVQHHHGRIGGMGQQVVQGVHGHHSPAADLQCMAVLGAQGCFGVQPKGQRGGMGL